MSRNFGIMSGRSALGGTSDRPSAGSTKQYNRADSIQLARHLPPGLAEPNLAVVRDSSFLQKHELNPVERLDAELDDREFAAWFFVTAFGISVGVLLAIAVALLDWS